METTTYFSSLISLLILFILLFWLYKDYRVDSFRQKMFHLRDNFFDEANENRISFNSDAYGMLRSTMNGTIRLAHQLNLWQLITFLILLRGDKKQIEKSFYERLAANLENLSPKQVQIIQKYLVSLNALILEHILLSSVIALMTITFPLSFILIARKNIKEIILFLRKPLEKVDSAAFALGQN